MCAQSGRQDKETDMYGTPSAAAHLWRAVCLLAILWTGIVLGGCVSSIDSELPLAELPAVTVAAPFELVVSPSDPLSRLPVEPVPVGSELQVLAADTTGAWLLVHDGQWLGWMPSFFTATGMALVTPPLIVESLDGTCTQFLDAEVDPSATWTSAEDGAVSIIGALYRPDLAMLPTDVSLGVAISGTGDAFSADYVNVPLTSSEAIALFRFGVRDLAEGSAVSFHLVNPSGTPLTFEAAFFGDTCDYGQMVEGDFADEIPIGEIRTDVSEALVADTTGAEAITETLVVEASGIEVVTFQQRLPLTVTLFVSPGVSGTHTVVMPLDVEFQVRMGNGETTASARLAGSPQPFAVPLTSNTLDSGQAAGMFELQPAPNQLGAGRLGPTEFCGRITEDTTWDADASPYVVKCNLSVESSARLTIQPGTVVKFANAGLYVDGVLQVLGTAEQPVFFTSLSDDEVGGDTNGDGTASAPKAGNWDFVQFNERSDDDNSVITNLALRYAGGNNNYGAIRLVNASPVLQKIAFENNRLNGVEIAVGQLETDTWDNTDVVYVLRSNVTVMPDQTLTIAPGMAVKFSPGAGLYVDNTLKVEGTAEQPVVFTSLSDDEVGGDTNGDGSASSPKAGNWDFVQFNERSDDDNSVIANLAIRYAGGNRGYGAIRLVNASPALIGIIFENNAGPDIETVQ